jgi:hypothetical protein
MPREAPGTSAMTPLRASARRWSSAALGDLKPSSRAISARVGGMPVSAMKRWTRRRICICRGVRSDISRCLFIYTPLRLYPDEEQWQAPFHPPDVGNMRQRITASPAPAIARHLCGPPSIPAAEFAPSTCTPYRPSHRPATVASQRQSRGWSCIPASNLVQLRAAKVTALARHLRVCVLRTSRINNPEGD